MGNGKLDTIPHESNLKLSGSLRELERIAEEAGRFCGGNSLSGEVEFHLNLALEELFVNALRHGGCEGLEDAVRVRMWHEGNAVHVRFCDRGAPFDLTAAPEADIHAPLSERGAGGLGIHLVRQIMRDVTWRRDGEWNVLTMKHPAEQQQEAL